MTDLFINPRTYTTHTVEETYLLGEKIAKRIITLPPQPIALVGDLGAGKTTLIKGIIHGLTSTSYNEITSPTFQYASLFKDVAHFDLWRLSSEEEFLSLGLSDILEQYLCLIEWPDRIRALIPENSLSIIASGLSESEHTYTFFVPYNNILSPYK